MAGAGRTKSRSDLQSAWGSSPHALPIKQNAIIMKKTNHIKAMMLLYAVVGAVSCSIKEDRSPCPCWLDIDISGCAPLTKEVTLTAWDSDRIFTHKVSVADYPQAYETTVSKGMVSTSAYIGLSESSLQGRHIIIPEGSQADRIRVHASLVDCTGEEAADSVVLYRQYANVYMSLVQEEADHPDYSMEVRGEICGIDIFSLTPVRGAFRHTSQADNEGIWSFRLPRQTEDSKLTLVAFLEGKELEEFPLDEWIASSGYSWLDQDLKDIYINVDYVAGTVSIVIQGWQEGESTDLIL